MPPKRRWSSAGAQDQLPAPKRGRTAHNSDHLSDLSDELLLRILHTLPIQTLVQCQRLSHRFYVLAGDSQIWKNLYYNRFVLPRALRIPGIRAAAGRADDTLHFSSPASKWLDDNALVNRADGKETNWKGQYKLRHNWSIGACEVREILVADRPSLPSMLVRLAEGVVLTADEEEGLRAWDLKGKELITKREFDQLNVPTCLAVDDQESTVKGLRIAVGFMDGGWGTWSLDVVEKIFIPTYRHPPSRNGRLSAVAYAYPYLLTITDAQLLSLYTLSPRPLTPERDLADTPFDDERIPPDPARPPSPQMSSKSRPLNPVIAPHLLASLKSHTSWPPLSLSIRNTSTMIIASIAFSLPTYLSGYTIGVQELHLSHKTGTITFSRLASALPQVSYSIVPPSQATSPASGSLLPHTPINQYSPQYHSGSSTRPTSISYSHPYILATHPDNTLALYLCTSTATLLSISPGTKLWGHTSSISSAEITPRGKAVSISTRGNELRIWELEGRLNPHPSSSSPSLPPSTLPSSFARKKSSRPRFSDRSVQIRPEIREEIGATADAHGYDDEDGDIYGGGKEEEEEQEKKKKKTNNAGNSNINHNWGGEAGDMTSRKQWVGFDDEMVIVLKESGRGRKALMVYDFT